MRSSIVIGLLLFGLPGVYRIDLAGDVATAFSHSLREEEERDATEEEQQAVDEESQPPGADEVGVALGDGWGLWRVVEEGGAREAEGGEHVAQHGPDRKRTEYDAFGEQTRPNQNQANFDICSFLIVAYCFQMLHSQ